MMIYRWQKRVCEEILSRRLSIPTSSVYASFKWTMKLVMMTMMIDDDDGGGGDDGGDDDDGG